MHDGLDLDDLSSWFVDSFIKRLKNDTLEDITDNESNESNKTLKELKNDLLNIANKYFDLQVKEELKSLQSSLSKEEYQKVLKEEIDYRIEQFKKTL